MRHPSIVRAFVLLLAAGLAVPAFAELTVSVTLSGPIEELMPILEHLRDLGVGSAKHEGGMKLEMHSAESSPAAPPEAQEQSPQPPQPAQPPQPGFAGFSLQPPVPRQGEKVLLSALVVNGAGIVDTVSATLAGSDLHYELYDNGEHGDPAAGDGQWSAQVQLPPAGQYTLTIKAFDANGTPVKVTDAQGQSADLSVDVPLEIQP